MTDDRSLGAGPSFFMETPKFHRCLPPTSLDGSGKVDGGAASPGSSRHVRRRLFSPTDGTTIPVLSVLDNDGGEPPIKKRKIKEEMVPLPSTYQYCCQSRDLKLENNFHNNSRMTDDRSLGAGPSFFMETPKFHRCLPPTSLDSSSKVDGGAASPGSSRHVRRRLFSPTDGTTIPVLSVHDNDMLLDSSYEPGPSSRSDDSFPPTIHHCLPPTSFDASSNSFDSISSPGSSVHFWRPFLNSGLPTNPVRSFHDNSVSSASASVTSSRVWRPFSPQGHDLNPTPSVDNDIVSNGGAAAPGSSGQFWPQISIPYQDVVHVPLFYDISMLCYSIIQSWSSDCEERSASCSFLSFLRTLSFLRYNVLSYNTSEPWSSAPNERPISFPILNLLRTLTSLRNTGVPLRNNWSSLFLGANIGMPTVMNSLNEVDRRNGVAPRNNTYWDGETFRPF